LGLCHLGLERTDKAVSYLRKAYELEPGNSSTLITLGEAQVSAGDLDGAMETWQEALKVNPNEIAATYNLGLAHLQKGDKEKARELWQQCLSQDPGYVMAHRNLATLAVIDGDYDEAVNHWLAVKKAEPQSVEADLALAELFFRKGDYGQSSQIITYLLKRLDESGEVPNKRLIVSVTELLHGAVLLAQGKDRDGVSKWVQSMRHNPNFALDNGGFIARCVWPELIRNAEKAARSEDEEKAVGLVKSFVKEDTLPPSGHRDEKVAKEGEKEGKKGARSWFFRGKK